ELYWDRPADQWPRTSDGHLAMHTRRLDLDDLLKDSCPEKGADQPRSGP
ncbi:MAG: glyoxalase, partial [Chloroflexota bacterium]|nr:glyoxalase [Chloroflexota bacterium]